MQADEKQRILDTLLGSENAAETPADAERLAHARRLITESGAEHLRVPAATEIWRRHQAYLAAPVLKRESRVLPFAVRWLLPALGAVAAAAVFIWYPRSQHNPARGGQQTAHLKANYRDAADVYVKHALNYRTSAEGDTLRIAADAIEARIDFHANATTRTVVITTPTVEYRIVGTSIAITATPEKNTLHVAEGKVEVTTAGKTRLVVHGEVWTHDQRGEQKRAETSADKETYRQLAGGKDVPQSAVKEIKNDAIFHGGQTPPSDKGREHKPNAAQAISELDTAKPAADAGKHAGREKNATLHAEREEARNDKAAARAEREARRSEREARRSERQATKAERHK